MTNTKRKSSAAGRKAAPSSGKRRKAVKVETEEVLADRTAAVKVPAAFGSVVPARSSRPGRRAAKKEEVKVNDVDGVAPARSGRRVAKKEEVKEDDDEPSLFTGNPVSDDEARRRWPHRYLNKDKKEAAGSSVAPKGIEPEKVFIQARQHFTEALIDGRVPFKVGDDAFVQAGPDEDYYICRVVEMFEGLDRQSYYCAQWFYRPKDTVIKTCANLIDPKRIFLSDIRDDNPLDCLVEKITIVRVPLDADEATKRALLADGNFYYDMSYSVPFSTYQILPPDNEADGNESDSTISSESDSNVAVNKVSNAKENKGAEMKMLDLYSGCGAMSTGLCLGANMADVNLVTRWAVDYNKYACESLRLNHPETEVRNESAEDFLLLIKEWEKLCQSYTGGDPIEIETVMESAQDDEEDGDGVEPDDVEIFEVEKVLDICYGGPKRFPKRGLYLKIRWKNYGPEEDTWEPIEGLSDCPDKIKEFVVNGFNSKILPLPGDVDVICGGPPCQGISGFNRYRNRDSPLDDEKNKQVIVYMDIVEFLKPRFCLMENVVDIVKFAKGFLGRYALGRLVLMNYQARIGLMTAGSYGLPQFRMRMFMWGARPNEKLPQYPLPTHNVVSRGNFPKEFESNAVIYDGDKGALQKELYLGDAISDLPPVTNVEARNEIPYTEAPRTEFQKFIRLNKKDMPGYVGTDTSDHPLYDHQPYKCNFDDYQRICKIPKKKCANFRDLGGLIVLEDNRVMLDPNVPRKYLDSGKPLVPDYAISYVEGRSPKPFGRLWWDEIVPTVVTRPEPHNQAILHPVQDRVLTIRENARLQGFPDYYKLIGPIKERYMQVGNAVAVPVARALGYSLAMACKGTATEGPVLALPKMFPNLEAAASPPTVVENL